MAWYLRSRPPLAEPPADSPSTMKISHRAGSRSWQSASFPGRPPESIADLRRVSSRALRAASRARAASMHLPMILRATVECLSKYSPRRSLISCSTGPFDVAVEFSLGLAFELWLRQLHGDHRDQPFALIVTGNRNFVFLLLEHSRG